MTLEAKARAYINGDESPSAEDLVKVLTETSDLYHNEGESYLSDAEYFVLEQMLKGMDPSNRFLATVGSDVRGGKIDLPYPMGSLDQVYEGDAIRWVKDNRWSNEKFVVTDKLDGTSALLIYGRGGNFQIAYSR